MGIFIIFYSKILSIYKNYDIIHYIIGKVKGGDIMEILKGMTNNPGFPPKEYIYGKVDQNTMYYFIENYHLENGNIIATTNDKEALGHTPFTSLGVINKEGHILIPFENKTIKPLKSQLLLVEKNVPTTPSVVEALKNKSDPFAAQTLAQNATTIKKQMKDIMGMNGDFIFDNQFSEAAIYTMDGVNIANNYFSFIGENNGDYYLATNVVGATIMKFNPEQLVQSQSNTTQQTQEPPSESTQTQISEPPIVNSLPEGENISGGDSNSITPNIDIPIQNMKEEESPPIVNTTDDSNPTPTLEEETINLESENAKKDENSEITLNITENDSKDETGVELPNSDLNNSDMVMDEASDSDLDEEELESNQEEEIEEQEDTPSYEEEIEEQPVSVVSKEPYSLTDEEIATPIVADATTTIKKQFEMIRKYRAALDKERGEGEAKDSSISILREESYSQQQEIQSLRHQMNEYRTKSINLERQNAQLKGTISKQNSMMQSLEEQNRSLRNQVAGLHALSNAVEEAGVLIQPVEEENSIDISSFDSNVLDVDNYLNRNYKGYSQDIEHNSYFTENQNKGTDQFYKKSKAA